MTKDIDYVYSSSTSSTSGLVIYHTAPKAQRQPIIRETHRGAGPASWAYVCILLYYSPMYAVGRARCIPVYIITPQGVNAKRFVIKKERSRRDDAAVFFGAELLSLFTCGVIAL